MIRTECIARNLEDNNNLKRKDVITELKELLKIIYNSNGLIFGGFIRDFLVYNMNNTITDFKDIDIWFKNEEDKEKLLQQLEENGFTEVHMLPERLNYTERDPGRLYGLNRQPVMFKSNNIKFILDFVICSYFPVCDFSVNCLTYDGENFKYNKPYKCLTEGETEEDFDLSLKDILLQIMRKETIIFNGYIDPDFSKIKDVNVRIFQSLPKRRVDKMKSKGFTVKKFSYIEEAI